MSEETELCQLYGSGVPNRMVLIEVPKHDWWWAQESIDGTFDHPPHGIYVQDTIGDSKVVRFFPMQHIIEIRTPSRTRS